MTAPSGKRWQFTLRTIFVATTILAVILGYGVHFGRLTARARNHLQEVAACQKIASFWMSVSFHVPQEHHAANDARRDWHETKARECLTARWFPWASVADEKRPPEAEYPSL